MENKAAWIPAPKTDISVGDADTPAPGPGELLVKVKSIAFSPIEAKIQKFGTHPIPYPNILGTSFAGTVEAVGPDVTGFAKGDNITTIRAGKTLSDPRFGAYQKYALASAASTSKLPSSVSLHAASAIILNLSCIVSALSIHFGLDRPPLTGTPTPKNKKILIYGGSSSTGGLAVKYAASAGYTVITTSSPKNREFVRALGAKYVIDHTLPPSSIVSELHAQGPYNKIFDTIGLPPVTSIMIDYLDSLGGGSYNTLIPAVAGTRPIPESVKRIFAPYNFAFDEEAHKPLARWMYEEYVPRGLKTGLIVPTRQEVVMGGLEKIQAILDLLMKGGVSGRKLVMDPWE
ncbi:GroES-like protein [Sporormia fimetaria CBS 119925]|uniref:GroES-like protein n=1 Tax=Sporormia fimetaria CBS 119925 TaxID=1340428 RepID=A0A6A6UWI7_9PLEO|nr:GroES-like protein [Sporormia fimetaria CBS 119925]